MWIKHNFIKGKSHWYSVNRFNEHYSESAPSIITVHEWFQSFWTSHMSTSDDERSQ